MNNTAKTKLFFTDLDGTLLTDGKEVTPATKDTLQKWTSAGNKLVLSSGRAIESVNNVRISLGLDFPGMYLIGSNGGEIFDCAVEQMISRTPLTFRQVSLAMEIAKIGRAHV